MGQTLMFIIIIMIMIIMIFEVIWSNRTCWSILICIDVALQKVVHIVVQKVVHIGL